jgi:hypothetical protein
MSEIIVSERSEARRACRFEVVRASIRRFHIDIRANVWNSGPYAIIHTTRGAMV